MVCNSLFSSLTPLQPNSLANLFPLDCLLGYQSFTQLFLLAKRFEVSVCLSSNQRL